MKKARLAAMLAALVGCQQDAATPADEYRSLLTRSDARSTSLEWNGENYLFVDYPEAGEDRRHVLAPVRLGVEAAILEPVLMERDGGLPRVAEVGTANLDADPADELVVIWNSFGYHYDVSANMYDVQIFDDLTNAQANRLLALPAILGDKASGCECDRRDEPDEHFELTTIEAVEAFVRNHD